MTPVDPQTLDRLVEWIRQRRDDETADEFCKLALQEAAEGAQEINVLELISQAHGRAHPEATVDAIVLANGHPTSHIHMQQPE